MLYQTLLVRRVLAVLLMVIGCLGAALRVLRRCSPCSHQDRENSGCHERVVPTLEVFHLHYPLVCGAHDHTGGSTSW